MEVDGRLDEILMSNQMNHKELERWYRLKNIKKASQVLVVTAVVLFLSGLAASRFLADPPENFTVTVGSGSGSRLENFTYSSPGAHPWELAASTALVSDSLDKVDLSKPSVVYHGGKGGRIYLSAESGTLDRKNNDVCAEGNVRIDYKDYKFTTGEIKYSHASRQADSSAPVSLEGEGIILTGKGLRLSVEKEEIEIKHDVRARLFNVKRVGPENRLPM